jgi:short-subunit dehydrogenase
MSSEAATAPGGRRSGAGREGAGLLRRGPRWPPAGALVTGASGGIGGALATALAGTGCVVLASGRDREALARLPGCVPWPADLLEPGAVGRLAADTEAVLPSVDVLVVAAGRGLAGAVSATAPERIAEVLELDLAVPVQLVRALLPGMLARGRGRIVIVGSVAGALAVRDEAVYSAAKAGLAAFASALRSETTGTGVTVTLAVPGVVDTEFFRRRGDAYDRSWPRPLDPERVAHAILDGAAVGRAEVWTPRWLGLVARLRGVAPRAYHRLADASGGTSSARPTSGPAT